MSWLLWRIARAISFSLLLDPSSVPTPSKVERIAPEKLTPMIIDVVLGRNSLRRRPLPFQNDRRAVGHDDAIPDEQHARLPECDLAVVLADQPRALRDEELLAGRVS